MDEEGRKIPQQHYALRAIGQHDVFVEIVHSLLCLRDEIKVGRWEEVRQER